MKNITVVFWSGTGNTEMLANSYFCFFLLFIIDNNPLSGAKMNTIKKSNPAMAAIDPAIETSNNTDNQYPDTALSIPAAMLKNIILFKLSVIK